MAALNEQGKVLMNRMVAKWNTLVKRKGEKQGPKEIELLERQNPEDAITNLDQFQDQLRRQQLAHSYQQTNFQKSDQQLKSQQRAIFQIGDDDEEEEKKVEFEAVPAGMHTAKIDLDSVPVTEEQFQTFEFKLPKRELAVHCYHRLPKIGKKVVMDQYPAYFMTQQSMTHAEIIAENKPVEAAQPEEPATKTKKFINKWFTKVKTLAKNKENQEAAKKAE